MEPNPDYLPPTQKFIAFLKEQFEKFKKTPLTLPVGAAVTGLAFYAMLLYMLNSCLLPILPPFIMLLVFWNFGIKRVKKLLLGGIIACTILMVIETGFFVDVYSNYEPVVGHSEDYILYNGMVDPLNGDAQTAFNFTLDINITKDPTVPITNVTVMIIGLNDMRNETMTLALRDNETASYYYMTTISEPINQHAFWANVNGTWYLAGDFVDGEEAGAMGPIYTSAWEVAKPLLYFSALQAYVQFMGIYTMVVGMIWWTRRTRRMREKQLNDWETKRKDAVAKAPKEDTRVPSLAKAMGLEEEEDSFVCSECGADVPGDAKACPQCGEKFD